MTIANISEFTAHRKSRLREIENALKTTDAAIELAREQSYPLGELLRQKSLLAQELLKLRSEQLLSFG